MVSDCLTWIPYLCGRLFVSLIYHGRDVTPLPDDVVVDILSRLPAECVLKCRIVCKQWRALTSTSHFIELHLKRIPPLRFWQDQLDLLIFDEDGEKDTMIKRMRIWSMHLIWRKFPELLGSCDGLLLFRPSLNLSNFYICNPVTQEEILLTTTYPVRCCGFYFHSFTKEYRLLLWKLRGDPLQYMIYSLGSKLCRQISTFSYWPSPFDSPVITNGALHWMVGHNYKNELTIPACSNSIMIFNMYTEDFRAMPHPGDQCRSRLSHENMHLLEMKGHLCCCDISTKYIWVWVLEDYANWFWVRKYKVGLDWDVKHYPFDVNIFQINRVNYCIRVLDFGNDELLLGWNSRGTFRYHLRLHTVRKIERKGVKIPESMHYFGQSIAYTKSLVSLRCFPSATILT